MWFTKLFFYWFPGYDKFRTVAMILVIVEWTVPLLGAMGLYKLWKNGGIGGPFGKGRGNGEALGGEWVMDRKQLLAASKYTLVILGGVALMFLLLGGVFFDFTSPSDHRMGMPDDVLAAMRQERAEMLRGDSLRSLAFVVLCGGAVMAFAFRRIGRSALVAILAVLVCVDLAFVNLRFLPQDKFVPEKTTHITATQADKDILADTDPGYRVFNLTVSPFNDATTSYFHRSLGGYHGAKMQRYQDVIDMYLSRGDHNVVNMLNTRYFIVPDEQQQAVAEYNPDAYGAAWFVETSHGVATADEEILALATTDLRREMIVNEDSAHLLTATTTTADSTSYINLTEYRPNYLKYDYYASDETFAVFSEIYYDKGWQAYLDGEPREHFRADYILRGMVLPAGKHTVEFRFRAENFAKVSAVTLICSLLILASVLAAVIAAVICKRKRDAGAENAGQETI